MSPTAMREVRGGKWEAGREVRSEKKKDFGKEEIFGKVGDFGGVLVLRGRRIRRMRIIRKRERMAGSEKGAGFFLLIKEIVHSIYQSWRV